MQLTVNIPQISRHPNLTTDTVAEANVSLGEVVEYPEIIKMADVVDPDGNKVTFVQDISSEA